VAVKIRLRRNGCKKGSVLPHCGSGFPLPARCRFIEEIGYYNPLEEPSVVRLMSKRQKPGLLTVHSQPIPLKPCLKNTACFKRRRGAS
jgi:small subunit ribosomal protein S16